MNNMTERGIRVVCECSAVIYFKPSTESLICRYCRHKVYRDDKAEFKDKLKKAMKKV